MTVIPEFFHEYSIILDEFNNIVIVIGCMQNVVKYFFDRSMH